MKKGFTLIELLAVIVILAIIAVIATPIVLNIINDTKENANKRSIDMYSKAVENAVASYKLNGNSLKGEFTTTDGKTLVSKSDSNVKFEVDYTGSKVVCNTFKIYDNGKFYLSDCKVDNTLVNNYSKGEKQANCTLDDKDNSKVASLSDVVTCGTESFYVMKNANNEITMLAKYKLNVGRDCSFEYENGEEFLSCPDIIYSKVMQGDNYGGADFSTTDYWSSSVSSYPTYVYNENSSLYPYVSEYENYLKKDLKVISARATLMSYEQAIELGCENWNCSNSSGYGGPSSRPAPEWVYSTTYWLGSAISSGSLQIISDDGGFFSNTYNQIFSDGNGLEVGVRPVVTISTSDIK